MIVQSMDNGGGELGAKSNTYTHKKIKIKSQIRTVATQVEDIYFDMIVEDMNIRH